MSAISFDGIDLAVLVHALYHGTRPLGLGHLHDRPELTVDDARELLKLRCQQVGRESLDGMAQIGFDYLQGRPLKVTFNLQTKTFEPRLYDRDAGHGAAEAIIARLRAEVTL